MFDRLPPSGARRGGDPAEHVFRHDLDTFAREVIQNANDQRVGDPRVDFTYELLKGVELQAFLDALAFNELEPHLDAASTGRAGRRVRETLATLRGKKELALLRIEDRNTHGLTGAEDSTDSHFRALCKDTLFSQKRSDSAGGSFGLGKSVLWAFSGLSTVVFNSIPRECPDGLKPPRLIARAELPSHEVKGRDFGGSGWFGNRVTNPGGERAESMWGLAAGTVAHELRIRRKQLDSGTTILILGFREPAADTEESQGRVESRLLAAAHTWFWPAMSFEGRRLSVAVGAQPDAPPQESEVARPFWECWQGRRSQRTTLEEAGDVVVRELPIDLPATRAGDKAVRGEVRLVVRLAPERSADPLLGHVALFRGAGMVVKYLDRRALVSLGRPFHAVLACGEARLPEAPTATDRAVETFLRLAEPPGHDEWESSDALKETYQRGYAKALSDLKDRVTATLRELLVPRAELGTRGPERLMRRFPLGAQGRPAGTPTEFHFGKFTARLADGTWRFSGDISPSRPGGRWRARIRLSEAGEDGAVLGEIPIAGLELSAGSVRLESGVAYVEVPRGAESTAFSGVSGPVAVGERATALDLEVTGSREALT